MDDSEPNRAFVVAALDGHCHVDEYAHGAAALADFRLNPPDLVLLDLRMPHMDGFAVLRAIREDAALRSLRVFAFSASYQRDGGDGLLGAGFDGVVEKPGDIRRFASAVLTALGEQH